MGTEFELEHFKPFEDYRSTFENTLKEYVKITGKEAKTSLWESKFGGYPYLPKNNDYPKDSDGKYLRLLAQLNFEEIPVLEGFPQKGILQFYIAPHDNMLGLNRETPSVQDKFRVLFFQDITKDESLLVNDFDFLGELKDNYLPFKYECRLSFEYDKKPVSPEDNKFISYFDKESIEFFDELAGEDWDYDFELYDWYCEKYSSAGHKIGGYAYFTQTDPRNEPEYNSYDTLLLQIDTDNELDIMWSDSGVANFFINSEDLKNQNFTNILYNFDSC